MSEGGDPAPAATPSERPAHVRARSGLLGRAGAREGAVVVAAFSVLALVLTWPLAARFATQITSDGVGWDPAGYTWDFWDNAEHGLRLWGSGTREFISAPFGVPLPASANATLLVTLGPGLLVTWLAGPVVAYNVTVLSGLVLSSAAMYLLVRWLGLGIGSGGARRRGAHGGAVPVGQGDAPHPVRPPGVLPAPSSDGHPMGRAPRPRTGALDGRRARARLGDQPVLRDHLHGDRGGDRRRRGRASGAEPRSARRRRAHRAARRPRRAAGRRAAGGALPERPGGDLRELRQPARRPRAVRRAALRLRAPGRGQRPDAAGGRRGRLAAPGRAGGRADGVRRLGDARPRDRRARRGGSHVAPSRRAPAAGGAHVRRGHARAGLVQPRVTEPRGRRAAPRPVRGDLLARAGTAGLRALRGRRVRLSARAGHDRAAPRAPRAPRAGRRRARRARRHAPGREPAAVRADLDRLSRDDRGRRPPGRRLVELARRRRPLPRHGLRVPDRQQRLRRPLRDHRAPLAVRADDPRPPHPQRRPHPGCARFRLHQDRARPHLARHRRAAGGGRGRDRRREPLGLPVARSDPAPRHAAAAGVRGRRHLPRRDLRLACHGAPRSRRGRLPCRVPGAVRQRRPALVARPARGWHGHDRALAR